MNKQHTHEMKSLRKKLFAAVAMLLVACVMTVSSTYAWFTLSTAPEVKGITTTVGANGNLEIALGNYNTVYEGGVPGSSENSSMYKPGNTAQNANVTWGNLVDVTNGYGLENITLFPTRLNVSAGKVANSAPLKFANYGADGRVTDFGTALKGKWTGSSFNYDTADLAAGVNGIGASSAISPRAQALIAYKNTFVREANASKTAAENSIILYGADLAGLMIAHINATDAGTDNNNYFEYKQYLTGLITELQTANNSVGKAIRAAILAFLASANAQKADNTAFTDEEWANMDNAAASQDVTQLVTAVGTAYNIPTDFIDNYFTNVYTGINTKLGDATEALNLITEDNAGWDAVSAVVTDLVNTDNLLIMGETISEIKENPDRVVNKLMQGNGLDVAFGYTAGKVYSDLSYMLGEFSGTITFKEGTVIQAAGQNVNLGGDAENDLRPVSTDLVVKSVSDDFTGILPSLKNDVTAYPQTEVNAAAQGITDLYGYSLDLLFRTNAADSKLLLQTNAANRVYNEETANQDLMGGGSNMTFTSSAAISNTQLQGLMGAIRIVFYATPEVTGEGEILAVATLDVDGATTNGNQVKANLKLVDKATAFDPTGRFNTSAAAVQADGNGNFELTSLTANTPKRITALVYLDGDVVDNTMVSSYAEVTGMLNLQFSSTADLRPMDNQALKDGAN